MNIGAVDLLHDTFVSVLRCTMFPHLHHGRLGPVSTNENNLGSPNSRQFLDLGQLLRYQLPQ